MEARKASKEAGQNISGNLPLCANYLFQGDLQSRLAFWGELEAQHPNFFSFSFSAANFSAISLGRSAPVGGGGKKAPRMKAL